MQALCAIDDISEEHGKEIFIAGEGGGTYLVLLRRNQQVYAYHNTCPHQGRPMNWAIDQFLISKEQQLVCAHHGASFEIETGVCTGGPCQGASLKPVQIEILDQQVYLLDSEHPN